MPDKETVTIAGVPVTVQVTDGHLDATVGRFDPSAAGGMHIHPRYGTSCMGLYIADENGDTAHKPDQRLVLRPASSLPGRTGDGEPVMIALDTGPDMTGTPRATGQHKRTHPLPAPGPARAAPGEPPADSPGRSRIGHDCP